ncbi:transcriptional repressor LexA [Xylocopilactobacillus apicola]|uniref:LexA repressor n=1 Tax=Xylocopilactobacillus apicola TaxID=2932184 RepID=A0AAU9CVA9_9LACO|nr:transcriptional repressor LexA [Xylocopilactobacillus apicola]BDR57914.1 LexA repressor [Xylocopilactobacillus apicola]
MGQRFDDHRRQEILTKINQYIEEYSYPPSIREISKMMNVVSSSTAATYVNRLINDGYLKKRDSRSRTLEITPKGKEMVGFVEEKNHGIPLVGTVAAGQPIVAEESIEGFFPVPDNITYPIDELFMLSVQGDSMIEIGINNGDQIIVHRQSTADNGQIVVAMTEDYEATVKRFYKEAGQIRLHPENSTMADLFYSNVTILGLVISLYRPVLF